MLTRLQKQERPRKINPAGAYVIKSNETRPPRDLARRLAWEAANPRPEQLRRAELAIVRALRDAGFGAQSQVTHADRFEIATDEIVVRVAVNGANRLVWEGEHSDA